jgi:hypothetical protein
MLVQVTIREAMTDRLVVDFVYELTEAGHVHEVILTPKCEHQLWQHTHMIESRLVTSAARKE